MTTTQEIRRLIPCSCCGNEIVAERIGNNIVVRSKRHGRMHVAIIPLVVGQFESSRATISSA